MENKRKTTITILLKGIPFTDERAACEQSCQCRRARTSSNDPKLSDSECFRSSLHRLLGDFGCMGKESAKAQMQASTKRGTQQTQKRIEAEKQ